MNDVNNPRGYVEAALNTGRRVTIRVHTQEDALALLTEIVRRDVAQRVSVRIDPTRSYSEQKNAAALDRAMARVDRETGR